VENNYKKWKGEVLGLTMTDAFGKKKNYEAEFKKRVNANPAWKEKYGSLLADLENTYREIEKYGRARDYYTETIGRIEAFTINGQLNSLRSAKERNGEKGFNEALPRVKARLEDIYTEYRPVVDKQLFIALMENFIQNQPEEFIAPGLLKKLKIINNDMAALADDLYKDVDLFQNGTKTLQTLESSPDMVVTENNSSHANSLFIELSNHYTNTVSKKITPLQDRINNLQRTYMQAQMEVFKEKVFYPDANSTLRVTYGKVKGYNARDAVQFGFYTYLDGVMEKYKPGDYEFDVPEKLRELSKTKDYGQYGSSGKMPVCFIAQNHTTGGNSGSPALDAYGNLVGLNFDRVWEGTMSDINYDPSICRNIMVDIRYVLFIVDKYAGAGHLVQEMKLVHPKKRG